jgi:hypothetical protein
MRVQSFPEVWKECFRQNRWMSLTDEGVKYVQGRLNAFTDRYALRQGFWHMGEDGDIARRFEQEPGALDRASPNSRRRRPHPRSSCPGLENGLVWKMGHT